MKSAGKLLIVMFALLTLGVSAYATEDNALFNLVDKGDKAGVEALLAKGAYVNTKDMSSTARGETPLHHAAFYGHKDICELLLAKGADLIAKDINGRTPREWAAFNKKHDIVSYLEKQENLLAQQREQGLMQARLLEDQIKNNPRASFIALNNQLRNDPRDTGARRLIIKLGSELSPPPVIPEEARKHFVEGTAIVKAAQNQTQQAIAAKSFDAALTIAPWWSDAYYNLGVACELAENYDDAEQAFNFYLLSNPGATEKREVQDRIYALSARRKLAGAKQ